MTKDEQRRAVLSARRALSAEQRAAYSEAICAALLELPELRAAQTLLSYHALWDEVNPAALRRALGARIALPRCLPGNTLEARIPKGPLVRGPFGIPAPDPAASLLIEPEALELLLLPCLGFDAALRRLGHGGGYYDRYLPRCTKALRVCLAFEAQRLPEVVTEAHDSAVDILVTEAGVYRRDNTEDMMQ